MSTQTVTDIRDLTVMHCKECGIPYAMPEDFRRARKENGKTWYCPNGHPWVYTRSALDDERHRRQELERLLASREDDLRAERMSHAATKGTLTKERKRAAAALCPCCNRSFVQLRRHLATKHPDYVPL